MGIIIDGKFTEFNKTVEIETIGGRPPMMPDDIIGVDGDRFNSSNWNIEQIYEFRCKLYEAYKKQELDDKLHYETNIDVLTAKEFLYDNCIQCYGIIDNIVSALIYENDIIVKWMIDGKEYEYTFEGIGYELLKKVKIESLKK